GAQLITMYNGIDGGFEDSEYDEYCDDPSRYGTEFDEPVPNTTHSAFGNLC
ncbi:hypothetical protein KM043_000145, partial [Ampulex compressa]